jgi:DNA-binding NarL/FixJ family response regulator
MAGARRTDASSPGMEQPSKQTIDAAAPIVRRGPYRAARDDPLGLTSRERCVLVFLEQGLSNRAIARRLCRSERTIEHHVSSLFAKLGIASRSELESPARNLGTANASTQRLNSIAFRK